MTALVPLFLVSLAALGCEIALTRYFAVAKWSEYGYWVISIVMVGFALSGVVLALSRDALVRHGNRLLSVLPALLILTGALGYHATTINPFNPLQLQNQATWLPQLGYIALYYASLLPFFFLAGLFVSLSFVLHPGRTGLVYAFDLTGAGAGAALVLALMFLVPPFHLVAALLPALALAVLFVPGRRWPVVFATLLALVAAEALLLLDDQARFNDFKPIYAPLHTPDARVLAELRSPRGEYLLLDDFTERVDTDVSNDAGMLGLPGPPRSFGLYRDGDRIASLPRPGPVDVGYAGAALDALPYRLVPGARVLLIGGGGGFRPAEVLALGAAHVTVVDPEPALLDALRHGLGASPSLAADPRIRISAAAPLAAVRDAGREVGQGGEPYDIIDLSADFLDAAEANATAFSVEALAADFAALAPNGLLSVPVSIRDFPTYADRMLATARAVLLASGVADPARHVVAYRSAWNVRILLARAPWDAARIDAVRRFCDDRSFDVSWYPGIEVAAARSKLYNDLPSVSFAEGTTEQTGPDDSIADEAGAMLDGAPTASRQAFDLVPITLDRPFFYAILRLDQLGTVLRRLEVLPQPEIAGLVNLAVLAQAAVIALLVLLVPAVAPRRIRDRATGMLRPIIYFPALGLGFLFIEIYLIGQASLWLHDRTSGFALVLTGMLVFSGLGSLLADRLYGAPARAVAVATLVALVWTAAVLLGLRPLMLATLSLSWGARAALVLGVAAPVSLALGLPFPLGLSRLGGGFMLPWAWALNGAFSVVATPLANLIAREAGYDRVLLCAALLYVLALITFPAARKNSSVARSDGAISRRGLIAGAAALAASRPVLAAPGAAPGATQAVAQGAWTHEAYVAAMRASGRPVNQTQAQFDAIQARKPAAMKRIEAYLKQHLGAADPAVMAAFEAVPRDYFHYYYESHQATPGDAYEEVPKPWALGYGSALSDYLGQAYMTQICQPKSGDVTLEIGTGSGFQSALLSRIVAQAYSIEIIKPLGEAVSRIFAPIGYANVHTRVGDGYYGWTEVAGGFDIVIVTCAAQYAPPDLFKQMKPGGRMIIPIGQPMKRGQVLYVYTKDAEGKIHSRRDMGVFFIPMTGAMMKLPPPAQSAPTPQTKTEQVKTTTE